LSALDRQLLAPHAIAVSEPTVLAGRAEAAKNNLSNTMEIKIKKINEIIPYEGNPRLNDAAIDAVAQSIKAFGWRNPIIVDRDHVIIAGHTRLKAAQKLGWGEVPVHVADDLTPSQVKALRIADNKTAELSEWNYELLPIELKDLEGANFDLSLLGFDSNELEELLKGNELDEGETDPDDVREVPEKSNSIKGEVYQLGAHRLMCGDGTCTADIPIEADGRANLFDGPTARSKGDFCFSVVIV
jgi:site-specific DNA-methyltransferase (adenine-specific)